MPLTPRMKLAELEALYRVGFIDVETFQQEKLRLYKFPEKPTLNDPLRKHCQALFDAKRMAWEAARVKRQSTVPSTQEFAGTLEGMYNGMAHESAMKIKEMCG